ncbi:unnamed protein product, partial [Oppiella nova]
MPGPNPMTTTALNNPNGNLLNTSTSRRDGLSVHVHLNHNHQMAALPDQSSDLFTDRSPNIIQSSHKNYEEVALIGSGAYGTVYKARDLNND